MSSLTAVLPNMTTAWRIRSIQGPGPVRRPLFLIRRGSMSSMLRADRSCGAAGITSA
jgi:hypothetical protein